MLTLAAPEVAASCVFLFQITVLVPQTLAHGAGHVPTVHIALGRVQSATMSTSLQPALASTVEHVIKGRFSLCAPRQLNMVFVRRKMNHCG